MDTSSLSKSVGEFIRREVRDWDDEVKASARFKAFSGQRSDWEARFEFWRDLILKVARHLGLFLIRPSEVKNIWFNRGGLTPLCLDHVLLEMYNAGDIVRSGDLVDPRSGRLSWIFRKLIHLGSLSRSSTPENIAEDHLILLSLLKDKAVEIVKVLSENHWTSTCVITMRKFQDICGGFKEAHAILSYLSGCGKARYLAINKKELIEGVKVSLCQQQFLLDVIDQRCETSKHLALATLKSGNRKIALRHARELKLASESREKCTGLLNRVEEVLRIIADAESSKKVSEAIQIGARAIKENSMSVEEVQNCLQELDESIDLYKQVEEVLESTPYTVFEDEDVADEFNKLKLDVGCESSQVPIPEVGLNGVVRETEAPGSAALLGDCLSKLKLTDAAVLESESVIRHYGINEE
ncbi:hypothetical protein F0562_000692 [Nyssa sinensis]|uniref:Charged multivesicular body protein 7 n=1 Tax=Nyssa sinensis TaxID=561372 RepID=A0A5J5C165_9ASTE|nr:hypothetical protein F0562_000692 [Nyssa sinensis]